MAETSPDRAELAFALAKFGEDARRWDDNKAMMRQAEQAAKAINIDSLVFGPAAWFSLAEKYTEVQQMIVDRCAEGAAEFGAIADNLIKARDTYQRDEDRNVHAINQVW